MGCFILLQAPASDATAATKITKFQKELQYQEELIASIKARTGKDTVLPGFTASPTDAAVGTSKPRTLKFEDSNIEKVTVVTPASVPTPDPAVPSQVAAPKPAPVAAAAPKPVVSAPVVAAPKAAAPAVTAAPAAAPAAASSEPAGKI